MRAEKKVSINASPIIDPLPYLTSLLPTFSKFDILLGKVEGLHPALPPPHPAFHTFFSFQTLHAFKLFSRPPSRPLRESAGSFSREDETQSGNVAAATLGSRVVCWREERSIPSSCASCPPSSLELPLLLKYIRSCQQMLTGGSLHCLLLLYHKVYVRSPVTSYHCHKKRLRPFVKIS